MLHVVNSSVKTSVIISTNVKGTAANVLPDKLVTSAQIKQEILAPLEKAFSIKFKYMYAFPTHKQQWLTL